MTKKFDVKTWLMEDLGFTAEECTPELIKSFESRAAKIEGGYLRQSDYSAKMNDLSTRNTQLTQEIADWTATNAASAEEQAQKTAALEALELDKLKLTQAATRLAEQAGVKLDDVLKGVVIEKKEPVVPEKFDPAPVYGVVNSVAQYMLDLATELPMIAAEHLRLTGESLDTRKFREELKARAAKKEATDPVGVWESMYDIPAKREAKRVADHAAEITAAEARGAESARSAAAIPGATVPGHNAPIFTGERKSALQRPQPGRNTAGFAQSLAKGTYRKPPAGAPAR